MLRELFKYLILLDLLQIWPMEQNWKGFPPTHLVFTKFFQEHILKPDTQAWQKPLVKT